MTEGPGQVGLRRVLAPNPSPMTGRGTNTYLVGGPDVVAVDPGPDDDAHLGRVLRAANGAIRYVLVTHSHRDHAEGARRLADRSGALLLGPAPSGPPEHDSPGYAPDALLAGGDVVAVPGWRLSALDTPGHCAQHLCFVLEPTGRDLSGGVAGDGSARRVLLSGDHLLGGTSTVVAAPGGDMAAYLASLEAVRRLDPPVDLVAPGHGELVEDVVAMLDSYVARRLERESELVAALELSGAASPEELVALVYPALSRGLAGAARLQVWAHLRKLHDEGRASTTDPDDPSSRWTPV